MITPFLLLVLAAPDAAYVRAHMAPGDAATHCLRWPGSTAVTYHLEPCDAGASPDCPSRRTAVRAALAAWTDVLHASTSLTLEEGDPAQGLATGYSPSGDNQNVIVFRDRRCAGSITEGCWSHGDDLVGLTTTTYRRDNGVLLDADIELDAAAHAFTTTEVPCSPATCTTIDVQAVVTHELGHALGLDHVTDAGSTMFAVYTGLAQRSIDPGSRAGVAAIYPTGRASMDCVQSQSFEQSAPVGGCQTTAGRDGLAWWILTGLGLLFVRRRG